MNCPICGKELVSQFDGYILMCPVSSGGCGHRVDKDPTINEADKQQADETDDAYWNRMEEKLCRVISVCRKGGGPIDSTCVPSPEFETWMKLHMREWLENEVRVAKNAQQQERGREDGQG